MEPLSLALIALGPPALAAATILVKRYVDSERELRRKENEIVLRFDAVADSMSRLAARDWERSLQVRDLSLHVATLERLLAERGNDPLPVRKIVLDG